MFLNDADKYLVSSFVAFASAARVELTEHGLVDELDNLKNKQADLMKIVLKRHDAALDGDFYVNQELLQEQFKVSQNLLHSMIQIDGYFGARSDATVSLFRKYLETFNWWITLYNNIISKLGGRTSDLPSWYLTPDNVLDLKNAVSYPVGNTKGGAFAKCYGSEKWSSSAYRSPPLAKQGDKIELGPGHFGNSRATQPRDEEGLQTCVTAANPGTTYFDPHPTTGGSDCFYHEWAGNLSFEGINFNGGRLGGRSIIKTENPSATRWADQHPGFPNLSYKNCHASGGYDWESALGPKIYWGYHAYGTGGGWGWLWEGGSVSGIGLEHAFYMHNIQGDHTWVGVHIYGCGRTAIQITNRAGEGPMGFGKILIDSCSIEDVCLENGGGGSAITIKGHPDKVAIRNTRIRMGLNGNIHPSHARNITGALSTKMNRVLTEELIIEDCDFHVKAHPQGGSARREVLEIMDIEEYKMFNSKIVAENGIPAMVISPSCRHLTIQRAQNIIGDVIYNGVKFRSFKDFCDATQTELKINWV